ncbi:guanine deaminase [Acidovorax sp. PRC11]|uniref:guanine deaminase n=1 Tax=Acidovorax sp. PRC11 TaxID=2962592 RepID=UPI002882217B|nr:guanine deaminase [Acidovorax sp. PRC11]MDT0139205.1 guanine deaminase [Acidovorax sp. PRC11]
MPTPILPPTPDTATHGWRAALLRFDAEGRPIYDQDGLLAVGSGADGVQRVVAAGDWRTLSPRFPGLPVTHCPGRIIAPGFVDMHVHFPQTDVIGSPAEGLLPWLENYTFPHESRFADPEYARGVATVFVDELLRNGVTTALTFATSHPASVDALMEEAAARGLRLIAGKVLQDRNSPDGVRDDTTRSLADTEDLIRRWHGRGRLGYAITPRFAPSCSEAQLRGAGELAARHPDVWIQSHVAENRDEIRWALELFPQARSYLAVYDGFGLMRERAVYAHCIHFDDEDRALMRDTGTVAAVSPTSNLFLGSGFFDYAGADRVGFRYGLASDVGGGTSFSPFHTMLAAYYVGREGQAKPGLSLPPGQLWWQHTAGAARALGLDGVIGNLQPGCEADFVVLNPAATPLLARKTAQAASLDELLFAMIVMGDDRLVERAVIAASR